MNGTEGQWVEKDAYSVMVYRDGHVTQTFLLSQDDTGWWTAYPESQPDNHIEQRRTLEELRDLLDLYINGFMSGYDEGWEAHDRELRVQPKHRPINDGKAQRNKCCGRGIPSCSCEH